MEELCEVDNQTEILEGLFVDAAHTVIYEIGGKQDRHEEYLDIRVLTLLQRAEALGVDEQAFAGPLWGADFDDVRPHPESLGAGIDGGPYLEPGVLVEQHSVEDVAFAGSVLAGYCYNADLLCLEALEYGYCLVR